jgi:DNA-binding SARP family transcriptional activator/tetratricopeptide (TPR) repeat protein
MEFRVLGPLEVADGAAPVRIVAGKQRALLAVLLMHANHPVSADRLVDMIWTRQPPRTAVENLRLYVHRLRRALGDGERIGHRTGGYALAVAPGELDVARFEMLAATGEQAQAAGDHEGAAQVFGEALGLWRGPAYADLDVDVVRDEADRLEARRESVREGRIEADLALGRHEALTGELAGLVRERPLRERLRAQLMLALYRCGRQAEALHVYQDARHLLAAELGIEPGARLRELHAAILRGDADLEPPAARARRSPDVVAMLPPDVPDFVGRDDEMSRLDDIFSPGEDRGFVVISGTAGVGKTALAVHWARRAIDRFPDGQLYVDLAGYSARAPVLPIEALARFLRALGVEHVPSAVAEATGMLRTRLCGRRMVLVLDNARSADQVRPLLPGDHNCVTLVTSRERLSGLVSRDGAARLPLDVLTPVEAGTLLTRLLGARVTTAEPDATAELAQACAYLPLALRITAANLADRPGHGVAAQLAELRDGDRLDKFAVEGDEEYAVRTAFDHSYAGLDPAGQLTFRLLGLVPGPDVPLAGVARLSGATDADSARALDRLTNAHLVMQPFMRRYALHDLLRIYAAGLCDRMDNGADRDAAVARLHAYYLSTADAAARTLYPTTLRLPAADFAPSAGQTFADHTAALHWLDAERPNLLAIVDAAERAELHRIAWRLADTLRGYLWLRMDAVGWHTVATTGLRAAEADHDAPAQAAAHLSLADLRTRTGDYEAAARHAGQALERCRLAGWRHGEAAALGSLGNVSRRAGRMEASVGYQAQALDLNRRIGRSEGEAVNLANLGNALRELGRLSEAATYETEALALYRKLGSRNGEAAALGNYGETLHLQGEMVVAREHLISSWIISSCWRRPVTTVGSTK